MEDVELSIQQVVFARIRNLDDESILRIKNATGLSDDDLTFPSAQAAFLFELKKA
jgi:hypothetical protein